MYKLADTFYLIKNLDWREQLKRPGIKLAVASVIGLMVLAIIFTVPIFTVPVETEVLYKVAEVSYQPYTTTEYYSQQSPTEKSMTISDGYYTVVPSGIIIPFSIDKSGARLTGTFNNTIPGSFRIYNSANRIIWEELGNAGYVDITLQPGQYKAKFQENIMWGEDVYIYLAINWTEAESYTASQEITKYQEVPVVVEKQRKVIQEARISIWQLLFARTFPSA
jgi:hypothetical protein